MLVPRLVPRGPELISDGGGLPFPPSALAEPPSPLNPADAAAAALLAHLRARPPSGPTPVSLDGWRPLARTDGEVLFGRGVPPRLVTVAVRQDARRGTWACVASSAARPLRATRDGIRASSWRLDPGHELQPDETILRVVVTEQTFAGAQRAHGRVLPPDMFVDENEVVLTMFVTPRPGFQSGARNPETPVLVELPHAIGARRLLDGAVLRTG